MYTGTQQQAHEPEKTMPQSTTSTAALRLDTLLTSPIVRPEAVARARQLLASPSWCRAEEVASHLIDCLVDHQLP